MIENGEVQDVTGDGVKVNLIMFIPNPSMNHERLALRQLLVSGKYRVAVYSPPLIEQTVECSAKGDDETLNINADAFRTFQDWSIIREFRYRNLRPSHFGSSTSGALYETSRQAVTL
jgi:hypothetical protein